MSARIDVARRAKSRSGPKPVASRRLAPPLDSATARRAAIAIGIAFALLAALRFALAFSPGTWGFGLSLVRDLAPVPGWGLWTLSAIAFLPALARGAAPWLERAGDAIADAPGRVAAGSVIAAVLVWALPDRVRFVGDSLLRQRTLLVPGIDPRTWYPQALPFDLAIHHHLAKILMAAQGAGPDLVAREIGTVEAALMAGIAIAFARALGTRGVSAFAAANVVFWTGALTLFTGYNKGFAEMGLVIAAIALAGVRVIRTGGSPLALGILTAIALLLHRSALGVLPAFAFAWISVVGARGRVTASGWVALAVPIVALAALAPKLLALAMGFDRVHFAPAGMARGGVLAAAFGGLRWLDAMNLIAMLAPAALVLPAAWITLGRAGWRRDVVFLAILALPFLLMIPFVHAQQGLFRDWDCYVTAGVAVSMLAAWLVAETMRSPASAWLALPLALGVAAPALQWLWINADHDRGLARVRAFVEQPPTRPPIERTATWLYLGMRYLDDHDPRAADAYAAAAQLEPSPHVLRQWAAAETMRGDLDRARAIWQRMIARNPMDALAWSELLEVEVRRRDAPAAAAAAESLLRIEPRNARAREILLAIERDRGP